MRAPMAPDSVVSFIISVLSLIVMWRVINEVHGNPEEKNVSTASREETNLIVEKYDGVVKPPADKRSYRGLKLSNEMSVALISDPSTKISAVCLVIGVGGINDFPDVPGLANLVGHMMLYSSRRFPSMPHMLEYVIQRGGNLLPPAVRTGHQVFSFDIGSAYLDDSLDWFAELFANPLVPDTPQPDAVKMAVFLLHKNFEKNQTVDECRIAEVEKSTCRRDSMLRHSSGGNRDTFFQHAPTGSLASKYKWLAKKVSEFHKMWYSSSIMSLVVLGKEDLDELQGMVVPRFAKVENKRRSPPRFSDEHLPWGPEQMRNKIYIVPLRNMRRLRLRFPFPDDPFRYKDTPDKYFTYFINQDGEGSLSSTLRKRDYCDSVSANIISAAGLVLCEITCELTNYGIEHGVDDIIHLVFQYLHLVKTEGVHEKFFEQIRNEDRLEFFYDAAHIEPVFRTQTLACFMQIFPIEDVLLQKFLEDQWKPAVVQEILGYLRPDNMNVTVVGRTFAHIATRSEKYYGTKYIIHKLEEERIKEWSNIRTVSPELKLPQCNEFVPDNFDLFTRDEKEPKHPRIIHKSTKLEMWFQQEDVFKVPSAQVIFELYSSQARNISPFGQALWLIYETALYIHIKKHLKSAMKARFEWEIKSHDGGIRVTLNGPSQKLPLLLERLVSVMVNLGDSIDEPLFLVAKESSMFSYLDVMKTHFDYTTWYTKLLRRENSWSLDSLIHAARMVQRKDFRKFSSKSLRRIFIRGLVHGNCTQDKALEIVGIIEKHFQSGQGLLAQEMMFGRRLVELVEGSTFLQQVPTNRISRGFGHASSFQLHTKSSTRDNAIGFLLLEFISAACKKIPGIYDRDKSALTTCSLEDERGVREFVIMTGSEREPRFLEKSTEQFLQNILENLKDLSESGLEQVRTRVEKIRYSEASTQVEQAQRHWTEIVDRQYDFDRIEKERRILPSLRMNDLTTFVKEVLKAERRRRLVVQIFTEDIEQTKLPWIMKRSVPSQAIEIVDHAEFQTSLALLSMNFNAAPTFTRDNDTIQFNDS